MPPHPNAPARTVLFGAFDRHNFGDLLFPHVLERMLAPRSVCHAGLATRDLRACGGHAVRAFGALAAAARDIPLNVVHVGGELLTCDAWEAVVMLSPPGSTQTLIAQEKAWKDDPLAWAQIHTGVAARAPYLLSRAAFAQVQIDTLLFHAVGGVDLERRDAPFRAEVLEKLRHADHLSVRDRQTRDQLRVQGIDAQLIPDPAVMVAELFGARISNRAAQGAVKTVLQTFPQGYIAIQFDAGFGDDATLDRLACEIARAARKTKFGIVLFRAGAAPWHDDLDIYGRLGARIEGTPFSVFASLNLWDICALIAHSRIYCGSSLHGRIVAMAFARPRINLAHAADATRPTRQAAFAATWEPAEIAATANAHEVAEAIETALNVDAALLRHTADDLVGRYRTAFETFDTFIE
ncbi:polysaccharide pyruvyl transferase family protein [Paraburkholderia tagetis]|uniref:Polysaccharide pyruvyl transferase family protein n=1 Tax=Paraburkholderia tagetis TaxID=2913261 RepID=A0A9X1RNA9_9BURK|nr:polysaccharide pyruvyl transferase family protein [Paraburkholderia tagetis]MCG5072692.1 polysaccharide pyruvyl transferase family protein [Paraburkholderia tagetis]